MARSTNGGKTPRRRKPGQWFTAQWSRIRRRWSAREPFEPQALRMHLQPLLEQYLEVGNLIHAECRRQKRRVTQSDKDRFEPIMQELIDKVHTLALARALASVGVEHPSDAARVTYWMDILREKKDAATQEHIQAQLMSILGGKRNLGIFYGRYRKNADTIYQYIATHTRQVDEWIRKNEEK